MTSLGSLPLRDDLRGRSPYGAPVVDVPVRLNVNENSFAVPAEVTAEIHARIADITASLNRYPDREFSGLRDLLAGYLTGVVRGEGAADLAITPDMVWAANGSNEVLFHILQAFGGPGRTVLGFTPSYSMHPLITRSTGADWVEVPRGEGFAITAEAARRADRKSVV